MLIDEDGVCSTVFIRNPYNYDVDSASMASGILCTDLTRTQQQFKEECDINVIVDRFGITGVLPNNLKVPLMGEFGEVTDYQQALNKLIEADEAFMQMPAKIREDFQNDAGKFVEFVSDEKNVDKCREWGLARPVAKEVEPMRVRVVPGVEAS